MFTCQVLLESMNHSSTESIIWFWYDYQYNVFLLMFCMCMLMQWFTYFPGDILVSLIWISWMLVSFVYFNISFLCFSSILFNVWFSAISIFIEISLFSDFLYQEAFLTTYRTFISPLECIEKLCRRHQRFSSSSDPVKQRASREAFSLLVRVVSDLT